MYILVLISVIPREAEPSGSVLSPFLIQQALWAGWVLWRGSPGRGILANFGRSVHCNLM